MGNDEVRYVSEGLFKETTGNLSASIVSLTKRVEKVIDDHEERLRDQQEQIRSARDGILENSGDVEKICLQMEEHEGQTEQRHRDETLRVAKLALKSSVISVSAVVLFGVATLILKLAKVI